MDVDPELTDPLRQGRVGGQQLLESVVVLGVDVV